jgi:TctA family transporter
MNNSVRHERGYYWGIGYAIGFPLFFVIGLILERMEIFTAIGLVIGFLLGWILEKKFNKNSVELSIDEQVRRKKGFWKLLIIGILVLFIILTVFLLIK